MPQSQCTACHADVSENIGHKDKYALLKCGDCGTVVVDPWPTIDELIEYYQDYGKTAHYMKKKDKKIRRVKKRIARMMKQNPPGKRFIDVGCSSGFCIPAAMELGLDAKGIDIDGEVLKAAREEFGDHFEQITVENLAARIEKDDEKYDMAYASEVLEHVPDPDSFVAAVAKLLNKGGIFYVTMPDGGHPMVPKDFSSWDMVCPPDHLSYFTRKGLEILFKRHGFEIYKYQMSFKPGIKAFARKL